MSSGGLYSNALDYRPVSDVHCDLQRLMVADCRAAGLSKREAIRWLTGLSHGPRWRLAVYGLQVFDGVIYGEHHWRLAAGRLADGLAQGHRVAWSRWTE